ncbi:MAG TPA: hypothetical protein VGH74_07575 [Planctomycetaceae bacterium]|jgi:hypothetical protein
MRAGMSPEQLDGWMAFDAVEPGAIGPGMLQHILSRIGSFVCAAQGIEVAPAQFLPFRDGDQAEAVLPMQSVDEQIAIMERMAAR